MPKKCEKTIAAVDAARATIERGRERAVAVVDRRAEAAIDACEILREQKRGNDMLRRYQAAGCQIPVSAFSYQGMYAAARALHWG